MKPLAAIALLLLLAGCGSDTPYPGGSIDVHVREADGTAVHGAAILVKYDPTVDQVYPVRKPLAGGAIVSLTVLDACDNLVATLCDGEEDCHTPLVWDGTDENGMHVVDGVYTYVLKTIEDDTIRQTLVLVRSEDPFDFDTDARNAETDAYGRALIRDECLGFGTPFQVAGEGGAPVEYTVLRMVDVVAIHPDGRRTAKSLVVVPEHGSVDVDLVLPEPPLPLDD